MDLNKVVKVLSSAYKVEPSPATNPRPPQFVALNTQNPSESATISIEPADETTPPFPKPNPLHAQFVDPNTVISINPAEEVIGDLVPSFHQHHAQFYNYVGIFYLVYAAMLLYMFPSLIALVDLKFQKKARSPFETHRFFANTAIVAYIIAIPMSVVVFCLKAHLIKSSTTECYSHMSYRISQSIFYFTTLLAPLSFVLVLCLPNGFDFVGYAFIFTLFLVVVVCSFSKYIKLLCKKDASRLENEV